MIPILGQFIDYFSRFSEYRKSEFWRDLVVQFFAKDSVFWLALLSVESGEQKHFELPSYLIGQFFESIAQSSLLEMSWKPTEPSTSTPLSISSFPARPEMVWLKIECANVQWRFLYDSGHVVTLHGKLSMTLAPGCGQIEVFGFSVNKLEETSPALLCGPRGVSHATRPVSAFNDYGLSKKTMRVLEMTEVWNLMTTIIDLSLTSKEASLGPVRALRSWVFDQSQGLALLLPGTPTRIQAQAQLQTQPLPQTQTLAPALQSSASGPVSPSSESSASSPLLPRAASSDTQSCVPLHGQFQVAFDHSYILGQPISKNIQTILASGDCHQSSHTPISTVSSSTQASSDSKPSSPGTGEALEGSFLSSIYGAQNGGTLLGLSTTASFSTLD